MNTLFLLTGSWDLTVDSSGNIAVATDPYAPVQDAASAIRTYLGECYFDTTLGIPYKESILGHGLPFELYRQQAIAQALTVPTVTGANVFFNQLQNRVLTGQVQVTLASGQTAVTNFGIFGEDELFRLNSSELDGPQQLGY